MKNGLDAEAGVRTPDRRGVRVAAAVRGCMNLLAALPGPGGGACALAGRLVGSPSVTHRSQRLRADRSVPGQCPSRGRMGSYGLGGTHEEDRATPVERSRGHLRRVEVAARASASDCCLHHRLERGRAGSRGHPVGVHEVYAYRRRETPDGIAKSRNGLLWVPPQYRGAPMTALGVGAEFLARRWRHLGAAVPRPM